MITSRHFWRAPNQSEERGAKEAPCQDSGPLHKGCAANSKLPAMPTLYRTGMVSTEII